MKKFVFMESSWRDRNECEVGEDGFDMMSFRSSLSLLCRDQIGGKPEGMWVDQLRYYWNNPAKGWWQLGTEKVEGIRRHTWKMDETYWKISYGGGVKEGVSRVIPGFWVCTTGWMVASFAENKGVVREGFVVVHLMHEAGPGDVGLHFRIDSIIMSSIVHVKRPRMGFLGPTPS